MRDGKEIVVAVGWSALTALVVLLAFALGQLTANTSRAYQDGYKAAITDVAQCVQSGENADRCFEGIKARIREGR